MRFNYLKPKTLPEALEILAGADEGVRVLAGGTDLLVNIQEGLESPRLLMDIGALEELRRIREIDGRIEIGALVTDAQVMESELLRQSALPLVQGCAGVGSPQIRSRATLGGNVVNASPSGDCIPPLYVLGAVVTLKSAGEVRQVPIEEFCRGVKKTVIHPDEILLNFSFSKPSGAVRGFYKKLGQRKALAIAKISVAAWMELDGLRIRSIRLALGAVATTVIRARKTETFLVGKALKEEVIAAAARLISGESQAINDIRSTAEYRNEMAGVLLRRGLEEVAEG